MPDKENGEPMDYRSFFYSDLISFFSTTGLLGQHQNPFLSDTSTGKENWKVNR